MPSEIRWISYREIQCTLAMQIEQEFPRHQCLSMKLISEQWGKETTGQPVTNEEWAV